MTKTDIFIELARPDENGVSRWVDVSEFVGRYSELQLGNGGSWCRASSALAKKYVLEVDKTATKGNAIDRIRLNGHNTSEQFNHRVRKDIRDLYRTQNCVMLGVNGVSENTKIEVDHKDGRKNDGRVSNPATQQPEDFQPLCKAANDAKRQICKDCKRTDKRWSAKNIKGNPYDFYEGDENYTPALGCRGCYQFDPVEYRKTSVRRIGAEVTDNIMARLYPDE